MQTLYIDVYFLINFTVDLIALHLSCEFTKVKVSALRLVVFTILLSLVASSDVFFSKKPLFELLVNVICVLLVYLVPKNVGRFTRRFRFLITTYVLLMLIGGIVFACFNYCKKYSDLLVSNEGVNRKLLILALIILISIGLVKIFVSFLKDARYEKSIKLKIFMNNKDITVDCFVDTGNFLKDPIDMSPVVLLKESVVSALFPKGVPNDISDPIAIASGNVRLIPVKRAAGSEIHLGFRPKRAVIVTKNGDVETELCFIIDKEKGSYSGYEGLVPASMLE